MVCKTSILGPGRGGEGLLVISRTSKFQTMKGGVRVFGYIIGVRMMGTLFE